MHLDEITVDSFIRHTLEDAWRAGDPGVIDRRLAYYAHWSRRAGEPGQRAHAAALALQAEPLRALKPALAARIAAGEPPLPSAIDRLASTEVKGRLKFEQIAELARSFAEASEQQLYAYAAAEAVPPSLRAASTLMLEAGARPLPRTPRRSAAGTPGLT